MLKRALAGAAVVAGLTRASASCSTTSSSPRTTCRPRASTSETEVDVPAYFTAKWNAEFGK